ncbi:MAG: hypothetical protein J07HB67_01357 [halophilic archaeon J07HB67]|jgi:hypothetical protein|nr:MAG: hypothetical protein J07HB67_01357 [halophilic archaeon J07HB67]
MSWEKIGPGTYAEDLTKEEHIEAYTLTEDDIRKVAGLSEDTEVDIE